jgi:hypothetical protein
MWPPQSPNCTTWNFLLWGCAKDKMYSHRVNMLGELKAQVTSAIADVTKDML